MSAISAENHHLDTAAIIWLILRRPASHPGAPSRTLVCRRGCYGLRLMRKSKCSIWTEYFSITVVKPRTVLEVKGSVEELLERWVSSSAAVQLDLSSILSAVNSNGTETRAEAASICEISSFEGYAGLPKKKLLDSGSNAGMWFSVV